MKLLICCLIFYLFQSTSTKQLTVCIPINLQDQLQQTGEKRSSNSSIYFEETFLEKGGKGENGTQGFKGSKGSKGETGRLEEITKNEMYLKIRGMHLAYVTKMQFTIAKLQTTFLVKNLTIRPIQTYFI